MIHRQLHSCHTPSLPHHILPHRTAIEVRCSRATRRRRRRSRTPPCPLPSTTATCVSWRQWIHALHWCLAATAVSVAHVLKRCTTLLSSVSKSDSNAVASVLTAFHVSSELCVRCAVTFILDIMFARRRAMTFRLDLCIIIKKKSTVICCINCVALSFHTHFYSCIFHPCLFLLFRADIIYF